jgi:hypothetical protein
MSTTGKSALSKETGPQAYLVRLNLVIVLDHDNLTIFLAYYVSFMTDGKHRTAYPPDPEPPFPVNHYA